MTLAWSPPKMHRPIPIDGYVVERKKLTGFTWVRCHESHVPVPEFTVSNLSEEADYQFRVSAVNAHGQSPYLEFPGSMHLGKHKNPHRNGSVCAEQLCWVPEDISIGFKESSALTHQSLSFFPSSPVLFQPPPTAKVMQVMFLWQSCEYPYVTSHVQEAELSVTGLKHISASSGAHAKGEVEMHSWFNLPSINEIPALHLKCSCDDAMKTRFQLVSPSTQSN